MSDLKPGRYRHFKGNEYQVIGLATHSCLLYTSPSPRDRG